MNGIEALSASPAVQATTRALVHFLWQGTLVGMAAAWLLALLERGKSSTRYAVSLGALLVLLACPIVTALSIAAEEPSPAPIAPRLVQVPAAGPALALQAVEGSSAARTFGGSLMPWIFGSWLAGVALLSVYHLGGWRWTRRLSHQGNPAGEALSAMARDLCRRLQIRRAVSFLEATAVSVPTVVGWLRPVVLVPASTLAGLSPRQLEAILAHELAHVRRHDYLVNLFQTVVETFLFYHPAVWWISGQIRRERENCCDDLAVAVCGDRLSYARALVDLEGLRTAPPRLALAASGGSLTDRIRRLVGVPGRASRRPWAAGLLALALLPAGAAVQLACTGKTVADAPASAPAAGTLGGTWKADLKGDRLRLEMTYRKTGWGRWTSVDDYSTSQLAGFHPGRNARFELRREAGTFRFQGSFQGRQGSGTCGFTPNPAFEKALGGRPLSIDRSMELAVHDVSLDFVREMTALGLNAPEPREEGSFFHQIHGFARDLMRPERRDPVRKIIELRTYGITPQYVRGMRDAGYPNLQIWQLVELHTHGVEPDYVKGVSDAGYRHLPPFELVELHTHGIDGDFIRKARAESHASLTVEDLVSLKVQGM